MSIETTMYVHETTMDLIKNACAITGRKRNDMIVMLLRHAMTDSRRVIRTGCLVQYQKRDRRDKWSTVHVRFREDEADYFRDLRNFLKFSNSLILAFAVRDYLNEIVKKSGKNEKTDNYLISNYVITREFIDGLIQWRIYWGYPQGKRKKDAGNDKLHIMPEKV